MLSDKASSEAVIIDLLPGSIVIVNADRLISDVPYHLGETSTAARDRREGR